MKEISSDKWVMTYEESDKFDENTFILGMIQYNTMQYSTVQFSTVQYTISDSAISETID